MILKTKKMLNRTLAAVAAAGMCSTACVSVMPNLMMTVANAEDTGTTTTAVANETTKTAQIKVSGLEKNENVTVKAYRIVKGKYDNQSKLVGYEAVNDTIGKTASFKGLSGKLTGNDSKYNYQATGDNKGLLNSADMATIANDIKAHPGNYYSVDMTVSNGEATADVTPGMYMVLVSNATANTNATVYNPAVVSVNVSDANLDENTDLTKGEAKMNEAFGGHGTAYLKKSSSDFDKKITGLTGNSDSRGNAGTKGVANNYTDDVAVGDTVEFTLDNMTVPSYTDEYDSTSLKYQVTDTLSDGLDFVTENNVPKITVTDGTNTTVSADNYEIVYNTNTPRTFTVKFKADYLKGLAGSDKANERKLTVKLQAKVNNNANVIKNGEGSKDNENTATLEYSNSGTDSADFKKITKKTHMYTFGVDVKKVGADNTTALAGAQFTLYKDADCAQVAATSTEGDNSGVSTFTGIDSNDADHAGTPQVYYLKETKAPATYTLNDTVYTVKITPEYDTAKHTLKQYTVEYKQGDTAVATQTYTTTAGNETDGVVPYTVAAAKDNQAFTVTDTKLFTLPSTGARTALISTVIGAAGITIAIVMKKKKDSSEENNTAE